MHYSVLHRVAPHSACRQRPSQRDAALSLTVYNLWQVRDLDAELSDAQRAEALAFAALAAGPLEAATVFTTWAEPHSYSAHTRV